MAKTLWLWLIAGLIVLGFAVPYILLSGIERWHGAFLFWLIFGVAVWIILSVSVLRWTASAEEIENAGTENRP